MRIKLTEINILPIHQTKKGIFAFCNFIINESFKINDCAIAQDIKNSGWRLIYPIKQIPPRNKTIQVFYPINKNVSEQIQKQVIAEFVRLINGANEEKNHA